MVTTVFHAGERALQQQAGVADRLAELGPQLIRSAMPVQHQRFFEGLPFVVAAGLDRQGQPWASALAGPPGFVVAPAADQLVVRARFGAGDPLAEAWHPGAPFGLLGMEPATRRRNRANGQVLSAAADGYTLAVQQSFGNCPKYIRARAPHWHGPGPAPVWERRGALNDADRQWIRHADTCFIASAHPQAGRSLNVAEGVDVSHRGGRPGFIRVDDDGLLTLPDFSGNHYFNTLGNVVLNPRVGLLFIDFAAGDLLWVAATAQLIVDGPALAAFDSALRLLKLQPTAVIRAARALPLQWDDGEASPAVAATGTWL